MANLSIKQQMLNFTSLFKQLFIDYYQSQKKLFWLIQFLMLVSTATSIFWILSIILGVSHFNNPEEKVSGLKYLFFSWVYILPIWQWLVLASIAGVISAASLYYSFKIGVDSVLKFQEQLNLRCLQLVSQKENSQWSGLFEQPPKQVLLRILKLGVQLTGLVARRITRAFVPFLTFIVMLVLLMYLNIHLLMLLIPLAVLYIIGLYYINRYTSRVSTEMTDNMGVFSRKFNQLVIDVLNNNTVVGSSEYLNQFNQSGYVNQAELKYNRRLAEIHVGWLNTLFIVLGMAVIIVYVVYLNTNEVIDWQGLLLFLVGLRFASNSLQQIASTTVAFSRFLPEIVLLYRLLNINPEDVTIKKMEVSDNILLFINTHQIQNFELQIINNRINYSTHAQIKTLEEMKQQGVLKELISLATDNRQIIVMEHKLKRLQQVILNNKTKVSAIFTAVLILDPNKLEIQKVSLDTFLSYTKQNFQDNDMLSEMDIMEY
jgi:ABC-type multidrug transport system fused ATPase/permease subunit